MSGSYPANRTPHKGGEGAMFVTLPPVDSATPGVVVNCCVTTHEWTQNRGSQDSTTTCDFNHTKGILFGDKTETERNITWSASGFIYSEINIYEIFEPSVIGPVILEDYPPGTGADSSDGLKLTMPTAGLDTFKVGLNQVTGLITWEATGYSKHEFYITPDVVPS